MEQLWSRCGELEKELRTQLTKNRPNSPEVTNIFTRIKESFLRLLVGAVGFALEKEFESVLWKSVHRLNEEFRKLLKKFSPKNPGNDKGEHKRVLSVYQGFLLETSGFYVSLIEKLQSTFQLTFNLNEAFVCKGDAAQKIKYLALESCHKMFIYLGDLARYKEQSSENPRKNWSASHEYYFQAIKTLPFSGNPYNQLAVLATYGDLEYKVIFNYCMGLLIEIPFATVKDNLVLQFQKNKARYLELVDPRQGAETLGKDPAAAANEDRVLKIYHTHFVRLHGILFTRTDEEDFPRVCEHTFKHLNHLLHRRSKPLDIFLLEASLIISMGTAYYLRQLRTQGQDQAGDLEISEKRALSVLFTFFNHLLTFATTLCVEINQKKAGQSSTKIIALLEPSLPLIKLTCDWMFANQAQWGAFPPAEIEGLSTFWENLSGCLNALWTYSPVDFSHKHNIPLPEEVQFRCYFPLQPCYLNRNWSKARSPTNPSAFKEAHDLRLKSLYSTAMYFVQKKPPTLCLSTSGGQPYRFVTFSSATSGPPPQKTRQLVAIPSMQGSHSPAKSAPSGVQMDFSMTFVDDDDENGAEDYDPVFATADDEDEEEDPRERRSPMKLDPPVAPAREPQPVSNGHPFNKLSGNGGAGGGGDDDDDDDDDVDTEQIVYTGRNSVSAPAPVVPLLAPSQAPSQVLSQIPSQAPIGTGRKQEPEAGGVPGLSLFSGASQAFASFPPGHMAPARPQQEGTMTQTLPTTAAPGVWGLNSLPPWLSSGYPASSTATSPSPPPASSGATREVVNPYFQSNSFGISPFSFSSPPARPPLQQPQPAPQQQKPPPPGIPVPSQASVPLEHPTFGQGYFSFLGTSPTNLPVSAPPPVSRLPQQSAVNQNLQALNLPWLNLPTTANPQRPMQDPNRGQFG